MSTSRPLAGWDLATWRLAAADPALRSTMVGVLEISERLDLSVVLMRAAAAAALQERLRATLRTSGPEPAVVVLPEVDVRKQIKLLPSELDLPRAVGALMRQPFTDGDPLWRLRLLQRDGRTWIIGAMHHAIADGGGAWSFMSMLLDGVAERAGRAGGGAAEDVDPTAAVRRLLVRVLQDPMGVVGDSVRLLRSAWELVDSGSGPLNESVAKRSDQCEVAWLEVDLAGLPREVRRGLHHALVAAAATTIGAIADAQPGEQVSVNVPVAAAGAGHNQVVVARLPIPLGPISQMMAASRDRLAEWRAQPALEFADQLAELAGALPTELVASSIRRADVTVSTMPAIPGRLAVDGAAVSAVLPMAPPIGAAASITSLQFGERLLIGTSFDPAALPADWPAKLAHELAAVLQLDCRVIPLGR